MYVLIVEDDPGIVRVLTDYLQTRGHQTDWAANPLQAISRLEDEQRFDVVILDCGLPKMDGLRFLQFLRNECHSEIPVLVLTARDRESDKLDGFAAGADDYMVKPFSLAELEARLFALTRRRALPATETLRFAGVSWDSRRHVLYIGDKPVPVQTKVLQALVFLLRDPGSVRSPVHLEEHLWGDVQSNSDKLRQVMYQVRKLLQDQQAGCTVVTVHGQGYRLDANN